MAFRGDLGRGSLGTFQLGAAFTEADGGLEQDVNDVLSFVSTSSAYVEHLQSVESTLALVSTGDGVSSFFVDSVLAFTSDAVGVRTVPVSVSDTLTLISSESHVGPHYQSVESQLNLVSTADGHNANIRVSASNTLAFVSAYIRDFPASASSTISFVSTGHRATVGVDTLVFVSTAVGSRGHKNTLAFVQTASANIVYKRSADSEITAFQAVSYFVETPDLDCVYHPFVGTTTDPDAPTPPSVTAPVLGSAALTLTYPFVSPTTTLILRNPEFGNSDRLEFNRIRRETRGGTSILFSDPNWPKQQVLNMDISALTEDQAQDFLSFLALSLGQEVGLLDYENRQWRGIIMNPDSSITDRGRECRYETHLEFEGVLA